jgi:carboxymethylenebutenolidase
MLTEDLKSQFDSLRPGQSTDAGTRRRRALQIALGAGLGVGYAAAAQPVMAQTAVHTPDAGLDAGQVVVDVDGYAMKAYRAAPQGKTGLPVILVVQEIFGVHEYIADVCRRLAQLGYLAIAPDLYGRQGDASQYTEVSKLMSELVSRVPDAQVMHDLDAAVKWAGGHGGNVDKLAITGFCWGGRIVWLYTAHASVKAAVAWYGPLGGAPTELKPSNPVDVVARLKAPVLGLYGAADGGIPVDLVEKMKGSLAAGPDAARASQIVIYPDTPHGFHADYRASYRPAAAEDGWKRALAWFKDHGVG